ncbi:MAG: hypothetical protein IPM54_15810 [Polyangiaceae bacterium]|nr:hypothetical protein [Polyangiaceae bacterium]
MRVCPGNTTRAARSACLVMLAALGCEAPTKAPAGAVDAGTSPNASILPAPLAAEAPPEPPDAGVPDGAYGLLADSTGRLILPDAAAPPPEMLRGDQPMTAESPLLKDVAGASLEAVFRLRDVPAPPKAPEVSQEGIKAAAALTAPKWKIDLTETGRMRIVFMSRAMPLPMNSELRARTDRYGHVVLWPNATDYRVVPPGAIRTVLGERRVDVTPMSPGTVKQQGEGKRLGLATRKVEVTSALGSVRMELGKTNDVGEGGALLCRTLVEIVGVDPRTKVCASGEVPLSASYAWQDGGGIDFEVTSLSKRTDIPTNEVLVPPPGATYQPSGLPQSPAGVFLTRDEVVAFRSAPLALPPVDDPRAPGEGFVAVNESDALAYFFLDGVPVVAVPPTEQRYVIGTARGRYVIQWRTFLGDRIGPSKTVALPARLSFGESRDQDAGAPDGG